MKYRLYNMMISDIKYALAGLKSNLETKEKNLWTWRHLNEVTKTTVKREVFEKNSTECQWLVG